MLSKSIPFPLLYFVYVLDMGYTLPNYVFEYSVFNFSISQTHTVEVNTTVGGTTSGGGTYQENSSVTVRATANDGYTFKGWTQSGTEVSSDAVYTFLGMGNTSLTAVFEADTPTPTPTYKINVSATTGGTVSGGGTYQSGASITVTATASGNYQFVEWREGGNSVSTDAIYTFSASTDRTLTAVFERAEQPQPPSYTVSVSADPAEGGSMSGGGSSSNPGGNTHVSSPTTTTPTTTLPVSTNGTSVDGITTTASPTATVKGDVATSVISFAIAQEIIKQAVANDSGEVVIAPVFKTDVAKKAEITLPAAVLREIGQKTDANLVVSTPLADVTFQNSSLSGLSNQQNIVVTTEKNGNALELSIASGGQTVEHVQGGVVLTTPISQSAPGTVAVVVYEDGTRQVVHKSVVTNGTITVPLGGSATMEIIDNAKSFADVSTDSWAADAEGFASAHELFSGTSVDRFSPDLPMTRGMLAKVLHNLESNPSQPFARTFSDVAPDAWYSEAVAWAAERGIVSGYGNGLFGPGDNITREQLAVMLWRYDGEPAATNKELHFNDVDEVSGYALDALCWATENGIINGKGCGILDPRGQATRAQVAQMLMNYLRK